MAGENFTPEPSLPLAAMEPSNFVLTVTLFFSLSYARMQEKKKETKKVCVWTKVKIDFSQFL